MNVKRVSGLALRALAVFAFTTLSLSASNASGNYRVLYNFTGGNDGGNAATGLVFDASGNAYGTTVIGGAYGCGTVFKLTPGQSGSFTESVLYSFACFSDGKAPHGGVTFDGSGNLIGTTVAGGSGSCSGDACGTVFELTPSGETVLHSFQGGQDGFGPGAPVTISHGNIFGTTPDGGANSFGTVYELSKISGGWQETIIHAFTGGNDGATGSLGPLLIDRDGNIFGVAEGGGKYGAGTAFEMTPVSSGWSFKTIHAFKGQADAGYPYGGLIADRNGNLYGTTYYGGTSGAGTVYELHRTAKGRYREHVLYNFKGGPDGGSSTTTLLLINGKLYGTTSAGGSRTCQCGVVFQLDPTTGIEHPLHHFGKFPDGEFAYYGLTLNNGSLFGTTVAGGTDQQGTIFEIAP